MFLPRGFAALRKMCAGTFLRKILAKANTRITNEEISISNEAREPGLEWKDQTAAFVLSPHGHLWIIIRFCRGGGPGLACSGRTEIDGIVSAACGEG